MFNFTTWRIPVLLFCLSLTLLLLFLLLCCSGYSYVMDMELLTMGSVSYPITMIFDSVSLSFGFVVSTVSTCVFIFGVYYMLDDKSPNRFFWILLLFVMSMNLLIFSGSLFSLLLGWDGLGLTSFALIIYYSSRESLSAGFLTLLLNRVGDSIIILTTFLFVILGYYSIVSVSSEMLVIVMMLGVASLTKSAQYPFSAWLPAAMAAPTPVSALVHSSTLVTAGVYLLIRVGVGFPLPETLTFPLMFISSLTCLLGSLAACYESDLKKIIALSTLSQLGVMMYSVSMNLVELALFHLYVHAMFKALLFISAGSVLMMSFGVQDIRLLGGVLSGSPLVSVFFVVSSLCLGGMPFMSSFATKHVILEKMLSGDLSVVLSSLAMLVGGAASIIYSFRLAKVALGSPVMRVVLAPPMGGFMYIFPMVVLGTLSVASGSLFSFVNTSFVESTFIPSIFSNALLLMTSLGLIVGLVFIKMSNTFVLSSMFFLTPPSYSFHMLITPIILNLKCLDHGWLEPSFIVGNSVFKVSEAVLYILSWPNSISSVFVKSSTVLALSFATYLFVTSCL